MIVCSLVHHVTTIYVTFYSVSDHITTEYQLTLRKPSSMYGYTQMIKILPVSSGYLIQETHLVHFVFIVSELCPLEPPVCPSCLTQCYSTTSLQYHSITVSLDMCSNLYVDNVITGCDKEQNVVNYYQEARAIMCDAKLNLRSWSSNSVALTTIATTDNTAKKASSVNVLGLRWIPALDKLQLAGKPILTSDQAGSITESLKGI